MNSLTQAPWFRRSVRTFLQAFLALAVPGSLGWLHDLTEWSRQQGQAPFPNVHSLAYLGVSAILAGVIAVISGLWVKVEDIAGKGLLRTVDPKPRDPNQRGAVTLNMVGFLLAAFLLGLIIASLANWVAYVP